ncbi:type II secretion system protein [Peribacillus asahii]|uniref:type II secretion system protein n=1 Tax=Peribacillus asahii TaxID=228899 RepID=UPI002079B517|nr:type II secretion system protein [Peribacillus asahii]USK69381.1 type II secretion system GspH family protein [Peribacillus asahii]
MKKKLQKLLKNQKGLTLVELLAVVVILGIIAAIAVPSIANIIDNSKKDAHIANAEQMISAARLAVAAGDYKPTAEGTKTATMDDLVTKGYLENAIEDPDGTSTSPNYNGTNTKVDIINEGGKITYKVSLDGVERDITAKTSADLTRDKAFTTTTTP